MASVLMIEPSAEVKPPNTTQPQPTIEVQCELRDIHDDPKKDEGSFYARVKFGWRAANATYVLIKGYDNRRYPLTGVIDKINGGAYTFVAVAGTRFFRRPVMCVPTWKRGAGVHGLIWSMSYDLRAAGYFNGAVEFTITTSLSKAQIEARIVEIVRRDYGVVLLSNPDIFLYTVLNTAAKDDIFLYTSDFGFHSSLCDIDNCKKDGIELRRKVGFDIWVEKQSAAKGKTTYQFHILPNVISRPAAGNAEWNTDPDGGTVGRVIANSIAQLFG